MVRCSPIRQNLAHLDDSQELFGDIIAFNNAISGGLEGLLLGSAYPCTPSEQESVGEHDRGGKPGQTARSEPIRAVHYNILLPACFEDKDASFTNLLKSTISILNLINDYLLTS